MNYIDIIILVILLLGAVMGFIKGLLIEVATLAALVLGVYAAMKYSAYTEGILQDFLNINQQYSHIAALIITFLLVVILLYVIGKLLTKLADAISLGLVNKLAGAVFGAVKAFIIVCILLMCVDALNGKFHFLSEESLQKSILFYPFLNFAEETYHTIQLKI